MDKDDDQDNETNPEDGLATNDSNNHLHDHHQERGHDDVSTPATTPCVLSSQASNNDNDDDDNDDDDHHDKDNENDKDVVNKAEPNQNDNDRGNTAAAAAAATTAATATGEAGATVAAAAKATVLLLTTTTTTTTTSPPPRCAQTTTTPNPSQSSPFVVLRTTRTSSRRPKPRLDMEFFLFDSLVATRPSPAATVATTATAKNHPIKRKRINQQPEEEEEAEDKKDDNNEDDNDKTKEEPQQPQTPVPHQHKLTDDTGTTRTTRSRKRQKSNTSASTTTTTTTPAAPKRTTTTIVTTPTRRRSTDHQHSTNQPSVSSSSLSSSHHRGRGGGRRRPGARADAADVDREFSTSWICCECGEAECSMLVQQKQQQQQKQKDGNDNNDYNDDDDDLIVCQGICRRLFHYPCAGLSRMPHADEDYICRDCHEGRHACALCRRYGTDQVDVYPCRLVHKCGLFYHEACLELQDIPFSLIPTTTMTTTTAMTTEEESAMATEDAQENNNDNNNNNNDPATQSMDPRTVETAGTGNSSHNNNTTTTTNNNNNNNNMDGFRRDFKCPAHTCWSCGWIPPPPSEDDKNKEDDQETNNNNNNNNHQTTTPASSKRRGRRRGHKSNQKSKRSRGSNSVEKTTATRSGQLMRCLECPIAFHVGCIPPAAKFHELALLCHEHALTHKLPELDWNHSVQAALEAAITQRFSDTTGSRRNNNNNNNNNNTPSRNSSNNNRHSNLATTLSGAKYNKFFHGLSGTLGTKMETDLMQKLVDIRKALQQQQKQQGSDEDEDEEDANDNVTTLEQSGILPFCLPCEIKDDIHSKPPAYKHVHTLQYNPSSRPNRILPMPGEVCQCVGYCGDECINRVLYVECVGDKSPQSNCSVGKECGNRQLSRRQFVKCKPQREQGRGWGLVPCTNVKAGDLVIEYVGEVIDAPTKEARLEQWARDHPNDCNFYVMSLSNQWYIDARQVANLSRFINHSCQPNCRLTQVNVDGYLRNGIFALVDIPAGTFLSYDYRFDTKQDKDKFICRCGAKKCRGTMNNHTKGMGVLSSSTSSSMWLLSLSGRPWPNAHGPHAHLLQQQQQQQQGLEWNENNNHSKQLQQQQQQPKTWEQAKKELAKDQAFVHDFYRQREERRSQVHAMVPAASNHDEYVSNGVQSRNRGRYTPGVFLWRNAVVGSDWATRLGKLQKNHTTTTKKNTTTTTTGSHQKTRSIPKSRSKTMNLSPNSLTTTTTTTTIMSATKKAVTETEADRRSSSNGGDGGGSSAEDKKTSDESGKKS